jgi:hypothetical protein
MNTFEVILRDPVVQLVVFVTLAVFVYDVLKMVFAWARKKIDVESD